MNVVILSGIVRSQIKLERNGSGRSICSFLLETHAGRYHEGQAKGQMHKVVLFGAEAEFAASKVAFGTAVYVEGRLHYGSKWADIFANQLRVLDEFARRPQIASTALPESMHKSEAL